MFLPVCPFYQSSAEAQAEEEPQQQEPAEDTAAETGVCGRGMVVRVADGLVGGLAATDRVC